MQGVAAKNDASYDLSRARASVTGPTTIAASPATPSLPNGRIVTRRRPAPTQWRSVKSCPTSPSNPSAEPFRRCWYTQFLVALKESALPAPAGPTDVVYRFLYLPTFRPAISGFWRASGQTGVFQSITGARTKSVPTRPSAGRATISWISRTSRQTRATEGAT